MDSILDFTGKTALITGAASGFGKALSIELAKRGANLAIADYNAEGLVATVGELEAIGAQVVSLHGDVSDEDHAKQLVAAATEVFGQLDIAVNNAGIAPSKLSSIVDITEENLNQQMNVNVKGVAYGMKYQIQQMSLQKNGAVLNVSSMAGLGGAPLVSSYSAAKHAVIGLTKTAAAEFGALNIRVNAICPFFTETPMVDNEILNPTGNIDDVNKNLARGCPMKRIGRVEEIVNVMLMMVSPQNTYMNGIAIPVDGGVSAL